MRLRRPQQRKGGDAGLCVVSLFDGVCGAYAALTRLGIRIQSYYTAEIDDNCIKVQERHVPQAIQLGSVLHLTNEALERSGIAPHLVLGGSPCQDLSRVNPLRKGLWDKNGSGPLFFHYVRIKNFFQLQAERAGRKFFWLFENTSSMDRCTRLAMVRSFGGLRPVTVCSSEFVPMRRPRFFGGNLSSLTLGGRQKQSTSLILQDFLEPGRTALVKKLQTITTNPASQRCADGRRPVRQANGKESYLRLTELEVLFGYSRSWTDTGDLSLSARRQLIGRSFCVPVIASLLEELQILYKY
ncbi:hypothetical protein FOCC_FOCC012660 [Frankliniella occidentalis]|nr:hypothetical protein FOCC_FOCC012660 [Frankliniella occidentalis]